jgi:SRSO17 transposase
MAADPLAAIAPRPSLDGGLCRHPRHPCRRLSASSARPEIWLLAERDVGEPPRTKFYFVNLAPTASLTQIVRLAHQRWTIEQQYQDLKTELGLDHFEGRTFAGWQHHVVLTAITYNFLQAERRRARVPDVSQRARHCAGNLHGVFVCAATAVHHAH